MNRKKKINSILKKRLKKQNAKLHTSNKPKYISKAERARMELEAQEQASTSNASISNNSEQPISDNDESEQ